MQSRAIALIEESISSGIITQKTYDEIMVLVHKDGTIDELESKKLTELFHAIKSNSVRLTLKEEILQRRNHASYAYLYKEDLAYKENNVSSNEEPPTSFPLAIQNKSVSEKTANNDVVLSEKNTHFNCKTNRILEIALSDRVWIKTGTMIAYDGVMNFTREGIGEHGLGKLLKRNITGETISLSKAEGTGILYLSDNAKYITIQNVETCPLYIQAQNVIAFDKELSWDIQPLFNIGTLLAGGLFHLTFRGKGLVAFSTSFEPLKLHVTPGKSIYTDAKSTIAWSNGVIPQLKTDVSIQTLIGRSSGETVQIKFEGEGYVIVEP